MTYDHRVDALAYAMSNNQDLTGFKPFKKYMDRIAERMDWSWRMLLDDEFPFKDFSFDAIISTNELSVSFTYKNERGTMYEPYKEFPSDALVVGLGMLAGPLDTLRERNMPKKSKFPGKSTGWGPKKRGSL